MVSCGWEFTPYGIMACARNATECDDECAMALLLTAATQPNRRTTATIRLHQSAIRWPYVSIFVQTHLPDVERFYRVDNVPDRPCMRYELPRCPLMHHPPRCDVTTSPVVGITLYRIPVTLVLRAARRLCLSYPRRRAGGG